MTFIATKQVFREEAGMWTGQAPPHPYQEAVAAMQMDRNHR